MNPLIAACLLATLLAACSSAGPSAAPEEAVVSPARSAEEAGMRDAASAIPGLDVDIRYFGARNFTRGRVDGYDAPKCYLHGAVVDALARVEQNLRGQGHRLRVFDCYRPMQAVRHFVRWAGAPDDPIAKAEYYPNLGKDTLIPGYISDRSGHSRGATLDVTLLRCDAADCIELDMGTPFDFFDASANTDHVGITDPQRENRRKLVDAMAAEGFANYAMEWWHFTYRPEPTPATFHDFPVR